MKQCVIPSSSVRMQGNVHAAALLAASLIVSVAGCRGSEERGTDSAALAGAMPLDPAISDTSSGAPSDTGCVKAGVWSECNLLDRLESSGLAPQRAQGAIRQPFLGVPGRVITLGKAEVQAYLYADTLELQRDFAKLDTTRVAPPTMQISWRATPTLIRSNNLLAILLSNDETQIDRVRNTITAGLPALPTPP